MIRCVLRLASVSIIHKLDYNTNDDIHIIQYFSAKYQHEHDNRVAIIFVLHANHSIINAMGTQLNNRTNHRKFDERNTRK